MAEYWQVLFYSLIGGVFSLVGGILLLSKKSTAELLAKLATPFAAGALLAAAFFDLLPEAVENTAEGAAFRWVVVGVVFFFLLEYFLHWFHHHHEHPSADKNVTPSLIIIGDSIHNLLDGVAIGAAFLVSVPTGIVTALAVAAHEIPQEIGDFGLLLNAGMSRRRVILINAASALLATVGALITFQIGSAGSIPVGEMLGLTAGMFIYIAASDLIPTIHHDTQGKQTHLAAALLIMGVLTVGIATDFAHEKIEANSYQDRHAPIYVEIPQQYQDLYQDPLCIVHGQPGYIAYDLYRDVGVQEKEARLGCARLPNCEGFTIEGNPGNAPCFKEAGRPLKYDHKTD